MLPLFHILMPVDFSDRCLGMAQCAKALADRYQARLTLLHILETPVMLSGEFGAVPMPAELSPASIADTEQALHEFGGEALHDPHVHRVVIKGEPAPGEPARQIVQYAKDEDVDLIAMPTHGYGAFRRFLLGSITAKVLHDAPMPVLTGAHLDDKSAIMQMPIRRVLCAVDQGPHSAKTLAFAAQLACDMHAKLATVHIIEVPDARRSENFGADWQEGLIRIAKDDLHQLLSEVGATSDVFVKLGEPAKVVSHLAQSIHTDLLVIGRGPEDGHAGRLRTHAYNMIRSAPCPVISV